MFEYANVAIKQFSRVVEQSIVIKNTMSFVLQLLPFQHSVIEINTQGIRAEYISRMQLWMLKFNPNYLNKFLNNLFNGIYGEKNISSKIYPHILMFESLKHNELRTKKA